VGDVASRVIHIETADAQSRMTAIDEKVNDLPRLQQQMHEHIERIKQSWKSDKRDQFIREWDQIGQTFDSIVKELLEDAQHGRQDLTQAMTH